MTKKKDPLPLEQRLQVNKRLTLNLLIQGAASHVFFSAHHLAAEQFNRIDREMLRHYDRMIVAMSLGYWIGTVPLIMGNPNKYFRNLDRPGNPFQYHRFMLRFGQQIGEEAREFIFQQADEYGFDKVGWKNEWVQTKLALKTLEMETNHKPELEEIGKQVCSEIYGIPTDRLNAELTTEPAFGTVRTPKTWAGKLIKKFMVGWSAVERRDGRMEVVAKAWIWPLLIHELVKGTVELICLHGLSNLEDEEFELVMDETEHVEYEIPMLQVGGTFFKKVLSVIPREMPVEQGLMHVARMPAVLLDEFLFDMMTVPQNATERLRVIQQEF